MSPVRAPHGRELSSSAVATDPAQLAWPFAQQQHQHLQQRPEQTMQYGLDNTDIASNGCFDDASAMWVREQANAEALRAAFSRQIILRDVNGVDIVADADIYPVPQVFASEATAASSQKVCGNARLFFAAWYLQLPRFYVLLQSGEVHANATFEVQSARETVLHWLVRGQLPSGFRYEAGRLYQNSIDDLIAMIVRTPGADIVSPDAQGITPLQRTAQSGMLAPFLLLLAAGAADASTFQWDVLLRTIERSPVDDLGRQRMRAAAMQRCHNLFERSEAEAFEQPKRKKSRMMPCQCRCCQYAG